MFERKKLVRFATRLGQSALFWALAMMFFGFIKYYGLEEEDGIMVKPEFGEVMTIPTILFIFGMMGMALGIIYILVEMIFERYSSRHLSLGLGTLLKVLVYFFFIILLSTLMLEFVTQTFGVNIDNGRGWWRTDKTFRVFILYLLAASFIFSFIRIANEKFGKGVFLKMLLGKYRKPTEERRIFMFLDLKSSTTIAEQLGHFKYSQLIQDCFYDLNEIVPSYNAEIYQYVGDEVVLSWPYEKGLAQNNCIRLFFEFRDLLIQKQEYYQEKYDVVPTFKAGLHGGSLMVAEVGVVKKELAFHGDVINTSARIQSECNNYGVSLLISEQLMYDLENTKSYVSKSLGSIVLKGKNEAVTIYSLSKT